MLITSPLDILAFLDMCLVSWPEFSLNFFSHTKYDTTLSCESGSFTYYEVGSGRVWDYLNSDVSDN